MQQHAKKAGTWTVIGMIVTAIIGSYLSELLVHRVFFESASFDEIMMNTVSEINKICPMMIDENTRFDNAAAMPDKSIVYNYTLVNHIKDSLNIDFMKETIEPTIISNIKTNPVMKMMRENKATIIYSYNDKNGIHLMKITIIPDQYN
jgi:hypothetical protein